MSFTFLRTLGLACQMLSPEAAQHAQAGLTAQKQGHLADAILEFRKVTELAPQLPAAYVNLGAAYLENHSYAEAIPPLRQALQLNSDLPGAHRMLGYALLAQGYASEALPHLEQSRTLDALGVAQLKIGKLAEAVATLEQALKARPNDPDLLYYLGRASGLLSKNAFDTLESAFPESARARQALGENYAALGQNEEAERHFIAALRARADLPGLHLALGQLYTKLPDWPKAEAEFRAETQLQPGDSEAAYDLGQALLQQGKNQTAKVELDRANSLRPGMPEALYLLGKTAAALNDAKAAVRAWTNLIAQEPDSALAGQAHFGLATLYRKQGKQAEADHEMSEFRRLQNSK